MNLFTNINCPHLANDSSRKHLVIVFQYSVAQVSHVLNNNISSHVLRC